VSFFRIRGEQCSEDRGFPHWVLDDPIRVGVCVWLSVVSLREALDEDSDDKVSSVGTMMPTEEGAEDDNVATSTHEQL